MANDPNFRYTLVSIVFVVVILTGVVTSTLSKDWYNIYLSVSIVTLIGNLVLTVAHQQHPDQVPGYDAYGKLVTGYSGSIGPTMSFLIIVALAFGTGFGLVFAIQNIGFSIGFILPTTQSVGVTAGIGTALVTLFVVAFVAPDREEEFIESFLMPLFMLMFEFVGFGPPLILLGLVVTVLLASVALYIGVFTIVLGVALIIYEQLNVKKFGRPYRLLPSGLMIDFAFAAVFSSVFFAALHGYAYLDVVNFQGAVAGAFFFSLLMRLGNRILRVPLFSKLAHSAYNSATYVLVAGLSLLYLPVMPLLYALMHYGILRPGVVLDGFKRLRK